LSEVLCAFVGPSLVLGLKPALDQAFRDRDPTYLRELEGRLRALIEAQPEIIDYLTSDEGARKLADVFVEANKALIEEQFTAAELEKGQRRAERSVAKLEGMLSGQTGDGKSSLGDELECDADTLARDPQRVAAVFPRHRIGLGWQELRLLRKQLEAPIEPHGDSRRTDERWGMTLLPELLKLMLSPVGLDLGPARANSPIWKWAGLEKPPPSQAVSEDTVLSAFARFMLFLGEQPNRRKVIAYYLSRLMRREYGLGEGRDRDSHVPVETEAEASKDLENLENRLVLDDIWDQAPPAQREAMELQIDAYSTGRTLADVARENDRDPNVVRNNLQALKRTVRKLCAGQILFQES